MQLRPAVGSQSGPLADQLLTKVDSVIEDIKLLVRTRKRTYRVGAQIERRNDRIYFVNSPFALKDEIKAMAGAKWHGFDENPRKIWSVRDCPRNDFQLDYLRGNDPYEWFDRPVEKHEFRHDLMLHQEDLANAALTYHYHIFGAEAGTGKTLAAQSVMELSGVTDWLWIGPKATLPNVERELKKWDFPEHIQVRLTTYERLVGEMDTWDGGPLPQGLICDESSRLKNYSSQRSRAVQFLADQIRTRFGMTGYVLLMSGTPAPKTPVDWWSQCEIAWPGFLKEGSAKALQKRLSIAEEIETPTGVAVPKIVAWKDGDHCEVCGQGPHEPDDHPYSAPNEVAYLYERLKGLVTVKHKKDCLNLPDKRYRTIDCQPSAAVKRVAKTLVDVAPNTITGLTWLRELSDGFQYKEETDGKTRCTHCVEGKVEEWVSPDGESYSSLDLFSTEFASTLEKVVVDCPQCRGTCKVPRKVRRTVEVKCPKEQAVKDLLEECEENGRIVIFAGFTGSVNRCVNICQSQGWAVVRLDGRGYHVQDWQGQPVTDVHGLDYWSDWKHSRVAFVAHPESGGQGLTLTESRMAVFYSNSFKPEYRIQAEERVHRKGMDENLGVDIVDIVHLPSDRRVLDVIKENRRLELMTLGEFA